MSEIGEIVRRHMADIAGLFAVPLAARLGCSADEVRARGLGAGAFHPSQALRITLADRSTMHLRYAFFVEQDGGDLVGIFSEHAGYFFFHRDGLTIEQLDDGRVTQVHRWP